MTRFPSGSDIATLDDTSSTFRSLRHRTQVNTARTGVAHLPPVGTAV